MSKPKTMRRKYSSALEEKFPETIKITIGDLEKTYRKHMSLRYGENPHQPAAFYRPTEGALTIGDIKLLKTGKSGLSMTNVEDANNSMRIVSYFNKPAVAVMKHVNPSGAAVQNKNESLIEVYRKARDCDSLAAFGSVVGFNCTVDMITAEELMNYALSLDGTASACIGHYGQTVLEENAELVKNFGPTSIRDRFGILEKRLRPLAGPHALCWAHPNYKDGCLT